MFLGYENFGLNVLNLGVPTVSLTPTYAFTSAILALGFLDLKVLCFCYNSQSAITEEQFVCPFELSKYGNSFAFKFCLLNYSDV